MFFRRVGQRYGNTPEPITPYQRAAQVWDDRIGSARVQARNWRAMAFGSLVLSFGLAGGLIKLSGDSRVTPYVVEVDRLGQVETIGPAERNWTPTDAEIAWHLARFVQDVRSLPLDPIVLRHDWLEAYDYAGERAAAALDDFARERDPFKAVGERTVSVEVTSVVRASPDSFQVKWTEQSFRNGSLEKTERWTGIFTIAVRPPSTVDALRKNPIGLYIRGHPPADGTGGRREPSGDPGTDPRWLDRCGSDLSLYARRPLPDLCRAGARQRRRLAARRGARRGLSRRYGSLGGRRHDERQRRRQAGACAGEAIRTGSQDQPRDHHGSTHRTRADSQPSQRKNFSRPQATETPIRRILGSEGERGLAQSRREIVAWVGSQVLPHEADVRVWLTRRGVAVDQIDDVIQEAYCRIAALDDIRHIADGRGYLFRTARNIVLEQIRHARVVRIDSVTEIDLLSIVDSEPTPERVASGRRELQRVRALIDSLPERCRRIFELRRIQGVSQREIAEMLKVTENVVEAQAVRGLRLILKALAEDAAEPGNRTGKRDERARDRTRH